MADYLDKFQKTATGLNKHYFDSAGLHFKVGEWLGCAVLKIQKPSWCNKPPEGKPFERSIFFSIWVSAEGIQHNRLYYNIHALKLRELNQYKIQSREFAQAFRNRLGPYAINWPNLSTNYGPLTLMQGWVELDKLEEEVPKLCYSFKPIAIIIDELLTERKKQILSISYF
ncbi:hypothetical protein [Mucilaginibacter paludis]|nr:hypothetical protein [Mucilaginibacter paludis]